MKTDQEKDTPSCVAQSAEGGCSIWWNSRNTAGIRGGEEEWGKSFADKVFEYVDLQKKKETCVVNVLY